MLKRSRGVVFLVGAVILSGCGSGGQEPSPPAPTLAPSASVASPSASVSVSVSEQIPRSSAPSVETTPQATPGTPSPDPTRAGSLTETSLPQEWLGFIPEVVDPSEGEFNANGTWVHGQDSALIADDAFPPCAAVADLPVPTAALTGTYRNSSDAPGNGIALEFSSDQQALKWFDGYVQAMELCRSEPAGFEVVDLAVEDGTTLRDLRDYQGMIWAESVSVEANVVRLMIVQGDFSFDQTAQPPRRS